MTPGTHALCPHETTLVIQAAIEGLDPQQVLARDLLVQHDLECYSAATDCVHFLGPVLSAELKEILESAKSPVKAYEAFNTELHLRVVSHA